MTFPKHYSLHSDEDRHFVIHDKRDNKTFKVSKRDMHPATQIKVMKMQKMSEGGGPLDSGINVKDEPKDSYDNRSWYANYVGDTSYEKPEESMKKPFRIEDYVTPSSLPQPMQASAPQPLGQALPSDTAQPVAVGAPADQRIMASTAPIKPLGNDSYLNPMKELESSIGQERAANQSEFMARKQQSDAESKMRGAEVDDLQNLKNEADQRRSERMMQSQKMFDEISKGEIDPDHYWKAKGNGAKTTAAIGIILSGIGAGLSGTTTNMAMDVVNRNIDRDIDAQKANLSQKNNLYKMYLDQGKTEEEAYTASKADLLTLTAAKANQIAAQIGTPLAKSQMERLNAQLGMQVAKLHMEFAGQNIARQAYTQGVPMESVPYLPPEKQKLMVQLPNGMMAMAANEKAAEKYTEQTGAYNGLVANLNQLKAINTAGAALNPDARKQAESLIATITLQLNDFAQSHRISESDIGFQKGQMSDPRGVNKFLASDWNAATNQLIKSLGAQHAAHSEQYVPAIGAMKQRQQQIPFKRSN